MMRISSRMKSKITLTVLLLLAVMTNFTARPQEASQTITVCPEGPPVCQFQRIQDAINASPDGATIEVGPGTYQENLFIFHSLKLIGAGPDRTEIRSLSTVEGRDVILAYGGLTEEPIKVAIEGFKITGTPRGGQAIRMQRVFNVSLRNNEIIGGGILLQNVALVEIQGNVFRDRYPFGGIGVENSGLITIKDNIIQNNGAGIDIRYTKEVNIYNNTILGNRTLGINLTDVSQASIASNTISDNGYDGISVMEFEGTISKNIIQNNNWNGIELDLKSKATVTNNMIEMNGKSGIYVLDETVRASFEANTIRDNQQYGIWVASLENVTTCRLNRVEGNKMGDYAVGPSYPLPPPSEELRQLCEGGE